MSLTLNPKFQALECRATMLGWASSFKGKTYDIKCLRFSPWLLYKPRTGSRNTWEERPSLGFRV